MIEIKYMVVADAAVEAGGKHYIHGGGWDIIVSTQFPMIQPAIAIAVLLRVPWNDANTTVRIEADILDADAHSVLPNPPGPLGGPITVGRPAGVTPGNDLLVPLVFNLLNTPFSQPGDYPIVIRLDGHEVRHVIHLQALANLTPTPMG